jgi:hypothetical protein
MPKHDCAGGNPKLQIPSSTNQRRSCHPEQSEGSLAFLPVLEQQSEMFRSAQHDTVSVPAAEHRVCNLQFLWSLRSGTERRR